MSKNNNKEKGWHQVGAKKENPKTVAKKNNAHAKEIIKNEISVNFINKAKPNNNSNDDLSNSSEDNENLKRILCHNMIYNNECKYGDKCLYAHSLNDQNVNDKRKEAYELLMGNFSLESINLVENDILYKTLLELTRYCKNCNNASCIGGYNCKSGSCDKKYCICANDLNYGDCVNPNCTFIHLSKRGLKPYYNDVKKKEKLQMPSLPSEITNIKQNEIIAKNDKKDSSDDDSNISNIDDLDDDDDIANVDEENAVVFLKKNDYKKYINLMCSKSIFHSEN
jgi:hypothetical protein